MSVSEIAHKTFFANTIAANEVVRDVFVLVQAQQFQAKNGPFWRLTLQDASGSIEGKIWSPLALEFSDFTVNSFYSVTAKSSVYKDKVELSISAIEPLTEADLAELAMADFVVVSPFSPEEMFDELRGLCARYISHPPLVRFFDLLFADNAFVASFKAAPAAKAMHHAYAGGLLEHTLSICRLCMSIADNYAYVDRQILLAGAICHDLGKIWELTGGVSIDYTDEGRLVGHISLGMEKLTPYMRHAGLEAEHIMHLQHLILSHHGTHEFGAPRLPSTAEAFILHFADNIDAKLQQVTQAFHDAPESSLPWSGFIRGLDRAVYKAPPVSHPPDDLLENQSEKQPEEVSRNQPDDAGSYAASAYDYAGLNEEAAAAVNDFDLPYVPYNQDISLNNDVVFDDNHIPEAAIDENEAGFHEQDDPFGADTAAFEDLANTGNDDLFEMPASPFLDEVATEEVMDDILPASLAKTLSERVNTGSVKTRYAAGEPSDTNESNDALDADGPVKKKKTETQQKQPLPLLEQCSLLSKE